MKKKIETKEIVEQVLIPQFVRSVIRKTKNHISKYGRIRPTLTILVKKGEDYNVVTQNIPEMADIFETNETKDILKAVFIGMAVHEYFDSLKKTGRELVYMVHTEIVQVDKKCENELLYFLEKNLRNDDDLTKPTFYEISRGESHVNEKGEIVYGDIKFLESDVKKS